MKKTSITPNTHSVLSSLNVNSSLQNWNFNNRYQQPNSTLNARSLYDPAQSIKTQNHSQIFHPFSNHQSSLIYNQTPLTPVHKHIIMIPDVSKSVSRHKEGSKLSLQLNQISMGFNKQNKRIQQALFQIRQSTVKKQKQRYLKSISLSKKSQTSKKSHKIKNESIVKALNFENLSKDYKKQSRKQNMKQRKQQTKLKKKNLNELMKQQKNMLKKLGSNLRSC